LVVKAVNHVGASEASAELRVALGGLPGQPTVPVKIEEFSTPTSLMIRWQESTEVDGIDIDGYTLYMDDGHHGEFSAVYDGRQ
jgi:hypothetical protein